MPSAIKKVITEYESTLLDNQKLESIRELTEEEDQEDFLNSLIQMFFDRTPDLVNEIRQGIVDRDPNTLERSSHALKGTAGNIGANLLMKVCEQLEERGRIKDFTDVKELELELKEVYHATSEALRSKLIQS